MSDSSKTSFLASFPPIQGAIKTDGSGGGMRIQLDIPENQMEHAAWLISMRQRILRVTIEIEHDGRTQEQSTERDIKPVKRTKAKQRVRSGGDGL